MKENSFKLISVYRFCDGIRSSLNQILKYTRIIVHFKAVANLKINFL